MSKIVSPTTVLVVLLFGSILVSAPIFGAPTIKRPMELIEASIEGAAPQTVDPAFAYDTASGELIQNVYDTLITFDAERAESFLPSAAASWVAENITGTTSPEGLPWHYRYVFTIRSGMTFSNGYTVTPRDVEYSFEREMVIDAIGGPQWMLYEPLLNNAGGAASLGDIGNSTNPGPDVAFVGKMIDHAVESNSTHVWFNLAFPGAYSPFKQILCQTWSSILSRAWCAGIISNWSGDWMLNGDHTDWINYYQPVMSPFDSPIPEMMGSGPFQLENLDFSNRFWSVNRYTGYWRGWPVGWPTTFGSSPAGYVNHFVCDFSKSFSERLSLFLAGDVDFCAVPRQYLSQVSGQDGIRSFNPLPSLTVDACLFNFNISLASLYGPILPAGIFAESGIPSDFFGNPTWGVHVRRAFAYAFDYQTYLATAYLGEASHPTTVIIPGLPYYDPSIIGFNFNLTRTAEEFQLVPELWDTGFTIVIPTLVGGLPRDTFANLVKQGIESLNPKFHVNIVFVIWSAYTQHAASHQIPILTFGWLGDYQDPHDFVFPFYFSRGMYADFTVYKNAEMDALISRGVQTPDGSARATIYHDIQQLAVDDCPSFALDQAILRHFERDWVVGWYYDEVYQGQYVANLWKWYYVEEALQSNASQPVSNHIPLDLNYDGVVNMKDVGVVGRSFGAEYGPPITSRWNFRADVNNDRVIDMKDIGLIAKNFGKSSPVWTPS